MSKPNIEGNEKRIFPNMHQFFKDKFESIKDKQGKSNEILSNLQHYRNESR